MRCGSDLYSCSVRTSASSGAPGRPIRWDSCATVISVGEGMAASTSEEDKDAMFQPRPHGAIAADPLCANPQQPGVKVNDEQSCIVDLEALAEKKSGRPENKCFACVLSPTYRLCGRISDQGWAHGLVFPARARDPNDCRRCGRIAGHIGEPDHSVRVLARFSQKPDGGRTL